jgi:hypothetical protein
MSRAGEFDCSIWSEEFHAFCWLIFPRDGFVSKDVVGGTVRDCCL